jgi:hypothetical protein
MLSSAAAHGPSVQCLMPESNRRAIGTNMKILMFLAFLLTYVIASVVAYKLMEWFLRAKKNTASRTIFLQEILILSGLISFFAPLYFLCGYWNTSMFLLFLLAFQISTAAVSILWAFMGSSQTDARLVGAWAGADFGTHNPLLALGLAVTPLLAAVVYVIWCGVAYFTHAHSPELTRIIVQITLIITILSSASVLLQAAVFPLLSRNIDEKGRLRVVLTQVSGAIPNLLYLAVLISTFGPGTQVFSIDPTRTTAAALSLPTLIAVGVYLTAFVLAPYAIGVHQAKDWRISLLQDVKNWDSEAISVLNVPQPGQYESKLAKLGQDIAESIKTFSASDAIFDLEKRIESDAQEPSSPDISRPLGIDLQERAYYACHKFDPRFQFVERGEALSKKIESATADLAAQPLPDDKIARALKWSTAFEQDEKRVDANIDSEMKSRPAVSALLASAATAIVTPLLSGVGTALSQMLKSMLAGS